jgi:tRNA threonylcarbamoyladenosine biosynthesis protein TsaB
MIILASETSTSHGSVAVKNTRGEIVLVEMDCTRPHSETLLPSVGEVLSLAGLDRQDVEALAVGIGPGAFTGLRVGLSTFKGWAYASNLPVLPVSSLDAVALPVLKKGRAAVVIADARKGEVYACYYQSLDAYELPCRMGAPELIPLSEVPSWLEARDDGKAAVLGTGVPLLRGTLEESWAVVLEDLPGYPSAAQILAIGETMLSAGRTVGPSSLVPDYVRKPDAKPQVNLSRSRDP